MKKKSVFAACGVLLFAMTSAVAARQWLEFTPSFACSRPGGPLWEVKTRFAGHIQISDADGKPIGSLGNDSGGAADVVHLWVGGKKQTDVRGLGRHEIRTQNGELLGYMELTTLTNQEKVDAPAQAERSVELARQMYQPDVVTSSDSPGESGIETLPGLVAGNSLAGGFSWKVIGYAKISAEDYTGKEPLHSGGQSSELPIADGLPAEAQKIAQVFLQLAPARDKQPVLYWALPQKTDGAYRLVDRKGAAIGKEGTMTGYGRREITDETGEVVLVLNITPLPKTAQ